MQSTAAYKLDFFRRMIKKRFSYSLNVFLFCIAFVSMLQLQTIHILNRVLCFMLTMMMMMRVDVTRMSLYRNSHVKSVLICINAVHEPMQYIDYYIAVRFNCRLFFTIHSHDDDGDYEICWRKRN